MKLPEKKIVERNYGISFFKKTYLKWRMLHFYIVANKKERWEEREKEERVKD